MDRMFVNLDKYGNTSAASVPIALAEAVNEGRVKVGDRIVIVAFGAGFTSGAVAIEWTADPARGHRRRRRGRSPRTSAFGCRSTGTRSTRSRTRWPSSCAKPGTVDVPLDDVVPGEPDEPRGGARMIDLTGKAALVTGGSRGIGRAIVLRLATQGADVAFTYRGNAAAAAETVAAVEALGRRGARGPGRRRRPGRRRDASSRPPLEAFGKVDILVNNAGITRDDLIMRMTPEAWRDVLETNLFGAFYMIKAVTRPMLKARGGRIINITSVSGQAGQMGQANYSSAKAGLIGLTKATARELASRGITVNAVAPGFVLTELTQDLPEALKDEILAADAARPVRDDRGDRRRGRVPGLRRGGVHHGPGARRRRRPGDDVARVGQAGAARSREPRGPRRRRSVPPSSGAGCVRGHPRAGRPG